MPGTGATARHPMDIRRASAARSITSTASSEVLAGRSATEMALRRAQRRPETRKSDWAWSVLMPTVLQSQAPKRGLRLNRRRQSSSLLTLRVPSSNAISWERRYSGTKLGAKPLGASAVANARSAAEPVRLAFFSASGRAWSWSSLNSGVGRHPAVATQQLLEKARPDQVLECLGTHRGRLVGVGGGDSTG